MRYRCAAFDIDGTLLDSAQADAAGLHRALAQELGRDVPMDVIFGTFGLPGRDILRALEIPEADAERVMRVWQAEKRARAGWMRLFPGVEGALRALRARGVRLGVVTSKRPKTYALDFVPFGLDDCFDIRITCADTVLHKPHPEPLLKFLERAGAEPSQAVYIGDSVYDRDCARAANVDFALATWGSAHPDMDGATWRLRRPEDLLEIFDT